MFFEHLLGPRVDLLDTGAGTAYWTRYLASKSTGRCVGFDVSKEILIRQPDDPPNLELYIIGSTAKVTFEARALMGHDHRTGRFSA